MFSYYLIKVIVTNHMMMMTMMNCFLWNGWPTKAAKAYFQSGLLSEILTISNLWNTTRFEHEFRLCSMKLSSSDNQYTTAHYATTLHHYITPYLSNTFATWVEPLNIFIDSLHIIWIFNKSFWISRLFNTTFSCF